MFSKPHQHSKQPQQKERRRLSRKHLSYYLPVLDQGTLQVIGHLVDASRIGLLLDSSNQHPVGTELDLRIDTMPEVAEKSCIQFAARVKWCHMDKIMPNIFNVGLEISMISTEDAEILQRIADYLGSP